MASGSDDAEMAGSGELATGTLAVVLARQGRPQEAQEMVDKVRLLLSHKCGLCKWEGGGRVGSRRHRRWRTSQVRLLCSHQMWNGTHVHSSVL